MSGSPLAGKRVVVTRPRDQAHSLVAGLEELGAEVLEVPTIRVVDAEDPAPLRSAIREIESYDWIVFTSVNGVERFWRELRASGRDTRALAGVSLCAIGPATAAAIEVQGARADLIPPEYVSEAVADAMAEETELVGARVLLPRADIAREALPTLLQQRGAVVTRVEAYRVVADRGSSVPLADLLAGGEIELVTFTSSSTVRHFVHLYGPDLGGARVACIGPITSRTAREAGFEVAMQAEEYTVAGLLDAIRAFYARPAVG